MTLTVLRAGHLTTVQDEGRLGHAHLGVPRAGALDQPAYALANRLVGNLPGAAALETTFGGLVVRTDRGSWVAVTGADRPHPRAEWLPAGAVLDVGTPRHGVRSYLAVGGGLVVEPVLGSRSTDTLAWVGPPRVGDGAVLPVGEPAGPPAPHDVPRPPGPGPLRLHPGPRLDWFADDVLQRAYEAPYRVAAASDRVGLRLEGAVLPRQRTGELASEGMVLGAVQVPPSGQPVVLLADHPPTGGYPVVAVVEPADLWRCAQLRPGEDVRFAPAATPGPAAAPTG